MLFGDNSISWEIMYEYIYIYIYVERVMDLYLFIRVKRFI